MSLYYEAATLLDNPEKTGGSLKSRIYKQKDLKSQPAQLFALISQASKWSIVLKEVIEDCGLLVAEKKLTPVIALLLTHDLVLTKRGVAAPQNHVLKLAIFRHKARLSAEFTKQRIRRGYPTLDAFRDAVNNGELDEGQNEHQKRIRHPRWVRINTLKTSVAAQLSTTFAGYERANDLSHVMAAPSTAKIYHIDEHISNLLAFPPRTDLSRTSAYESGDIIFQDKASCFPAYLLDIRSDDGDFIDGCAAPGNKTTHLAAIISHSSSAAPKQKVFAFERNRARAGTLQKMVKLASAERSVSIKASEDFLAASPDSIEFRNVGAILLDPSCSGSGIVGRDDAIKIHLPATPSTDPATINVGKSKKRKRNQEASNGSKKSTTLSLALDDSIQEETPVAHDLPERLAALSTFQLRVLTHAMRFPKARKITYSTCSIHFEENEGVVFQALASPIAKQRGWRALARGHQVEGLRKWKRRGISESGKLKDDKLVFSDAFKAEVCDACIRCEKDTDEGTMGFFVVAFIRDADVLEDLNSPDENPVNEIIYGLTGSSEQDETDTKSTEGEEEWKGFSEDEYQDADDAAQEAHIATADLSRKQKKKRGDKRPRYHGSND